MKNTHHCIPLSLNWSDKWENKIRLEQVDHKILHDEQDVSWSKIRQWRQKVNHIILPNEFTEEERLKIQKLFFNNIGNLPTEMVQAQLASLYSQQSNESITRRYSNPKEKAHELLESQAQDRLNIILSYHKK